VSGQCTEDLCCVVHVVLGHDPGCQLPERRAERSEGSEVDIAKRSDEAADTRPKGRGRRKDLTIA
jgi:hypothetical protein